MTVNAQNIDCSREVFGSAWAIVTGGAGQISYLWSNNETTDSIWDLEVGNYGITATDGNGCSINGIASIDQDPMLVIDIDVLNEISWHAPKRHTYFAQTSYTHCCTIELILYMLFYHTWGILQL